MGVDSIRYGASGVVSTVAGAWNGDIGGGANEGGSPTPLLLLLLLLLPTVYQRLCSV